jgi:hypothetical protein
VRQGLRGLELVPRVGGYAEVTAEAGARWGDAPTWRIRGEAGVRPLAGIAVFGFGAADGAGWQAGAGVRLRW